MRSLLYIGILFFGLSCTPEGPRLHTGDLLFQVGTDSAMEGAITAATKRDSTLNFTHVGIFLADNGTDPVLGASGNAADSVLEATSDGGVQIVPLGDFLNRAGRIAGRPGVVAMRLRDTARVTLSVMRARQYAGLPYDCSYRPDNGRFYCSELVWESYRDTCDRRIFPARPMNFRAADGTMPAFWSELFEKLGEPIPEGVPGTNPNDMARDPHLREVGRWF